MTGGGGCWRRWGLRLDAEKEEGEEEEMGEREVDSLVVMAGRGRTESGNRGRDGKKKRNRKNS